MSVDQINKPKKRIVRDAIFAVLLPILGSAGCAAHTAAQKVRATDTRPSSSDVLNKEELPVDDLTQLEQRVDALGKGGEGVRKRIERLNRFLKDPKNNPLDSADDRLIPATEDSIKNALNFPEYQRWASSIELPKIDPKAKHAPWSKEKTDKYFVPKGVRPENLAKFYEEFDLFLKRFKTASNDTKELDNLKKRDKEMKVELCECTIKDSAGKSMSLAERYPKAKDKIGKCYEEFKGILINKSMSKCWDKSLNERMGQIDMYKKYTFERSKKSYEFLRELFNVYKKHIDSKAKFPAPEFFIDAPEGKGRALLEDINRLLVPHGYYVFSINHFRKTTLGGFWGLGLYKVESIKPVNMSLSGGNIETPIALLKTPIVVSMVINPEFINDDYVDGLHIKIKGLRYVILDSANVIRHGREAYNNFSDFCTKNSLLAQKISQQILDSLAITSSAAHESMHHFTMRQKQYGKKITNKGDVNMGNFTLKPTDYIKNTELEGHELSGVGFQLMHSGIFAKIYSWDMALAGEGSNYSLAGKILGNEIVNSPYISDDLKQEIIKSLSWKPKRNPKNKKIKEDKSIMQRTLETFIGDEDQRAADERKRLLFIKAIQQIPEKELHRIGERMAKLGIHLTK